MKKLARTFVWQFLITLPLAAQQPVQIVSVSPKGATQSVAEAQRIVVTFNQPMVALAGLGDKPLASGPFTVSPAVAGVFRWLGTSTVEFQPSAPLPLATKFTVTVKAGIKSISGGSLAQGHTWSFETMRPRIIGTLPMKDAKWAARNTEIYFRFNQKMNASALASFFTITTVGKDGATKTKSRPGTRTASNRIAFKVRQAGATDLENLRQLGNSADSVVVLTPQTPLPLGAQITVTARAGLPSAAGPLGMAAAYTLKFSTVNAFSFLGWTPQEPTSPTGQITFRFSNPVSVADLVKHLRFKPEIAIPEYYSSWTWPQDSPSFSLYLPPDTTLLFTIDVNMPDQFDNKLGKAALGKIVTTDYPAQLQFATGPGIVEAYGDKRVPVEALNHQTLPLLMKKLSADEIIPLFTQDDLFYTERPSLISLPVQTAISFLGKKNVWQLRPLELKEALHNDSTGIVLTQIQVAGEREPRYLRGLYQVTHLGLTGKFSPGNNLIFVTRMKDAAPVSGASVEVRDDQNNVLWTGATDAQGRCETPGWAALGIKPASTWQPPRLWIFVRQNADLAFLHSEWGTGIYPYRFGIDYEWNPQPLVRTGIVMTDRGLYRAGEMAYFKGLMREKDSRGEWRVPLQKRWQWRIEDSRNQEVAGKMIELSDYGAFDDSLKLNENAALGLYWMSLGESLEKSAQPIEAEEYEGEGESSGAIASGSFRVEAFRPAEFAVTALATNLVNAKRGYISGESVAAKISGRYLFGSPMRHAQIKWRLQLLPSSFSSERFPDYTFRQWRSWPQESEYQGSQLLASGTDSLDMNGEIALSGAAIPTGVPQPRKLLIEGEVTSPSGQALAGSAAVPVHAAEFYIGLRTDGYFFAANKTVACSLVAITPDDQFAIGNSISLRLIHRQWHSVRKAGFGGRYAWETTVEETAVDSSTIVSSSQSITHLFTPKKSGYYIVEASAKDRQGNSTKSALFFYVSGADYVAWERGEDDRIELVPNRRRYHPGDVATLMVQSPFEKCRALITIERESIFESRVVELAGTAPTIEVPIKENYLPNVFVSVALVQGRIGNKTFSKEGDDLGKPQFKIGYTNLIVDPGTRHLSVRTKPDKDEYRPGELVKIAVDVKGTRNVGVQSEVTLAVVDVGVLSLIGYELPDPFGNFYGPRPLSVRTSETLLHLIEQRNYGEKAEPAGGGGAFGGIEMRAAFKMTPLWLPALRTDANGHAEAQFKLPGNLTTFRIMAVAHTRDSRFGNGNSEFRVNKPLLMQAASPRFGRIGDRFEAGVAITNTTSQRVSVSLLLKARGVKALGDSLANFVLAPGESRAIRRPFFAEDLGKAVYQFRARMKAGSEDFTDGLEISIPILAPQTKEVIATSGSTEDQTQERLQVPGDIFADAGSLELTAASTAMVGLRESVSYLFEYPYGCLEQRLSRVLPMILAHDLVEAFQLPMLTNADYREVINTSLDELSRYQLANGGFSLWAGGARDWDYISALALYTLAQAQQNGFAVDENVLEPAKKYANEQLRIEFDESRPEGSRSFHYTRALLVHALAMLGEKPNDYATFLFEKREQMSLDGRTHLLRAAALLKKPEAVATLQTELMNKIKVAPATAHFEDANPKELWWCYYSAARTTALALQALAETKAAFPMADKVVRWLMAERKLGRWRNTQENSAVFEALTTYLRAYKKDVPNFTAEIRIAGKNYLKELFAGRASETRKTEIALDRFEQQQGLPVEIQKTGAGRFYYGLRMTYYPMQPSPHRDQGIAIKKEIRKLESSNGQTTIYSPGDVVQITLRVIAAQERHFVVVDDPLPAGFEAINPRLKITATAYQQEGERESTGWWRTGFDHVERRDDRVMLFANLLSAGEHVFTYLARATTPGTFTLPSTHAEEMYTPEVFGKFQGRVIEIK